MDRRLERKCIAFRRRFANRPLQGIIQVAIIAFLVTLIIYLSARLLFPSVRNLVAPTKPPTTTTTKPPTTTTTKKPILKSSFNVGCFADQTSVTLADGSTRSLDSLKIGDDVLVHHPSGYTQPSRVLSIFRHQRRSVQLLDIHTADEHEPLRLTPSHSILTLKNHAGDDSPDYDFASNVAVGDFVFSSKLEAVRVTDIREVTLYNQTISTPMTNEGTIIVNDLVASCYATYPHHFMHLLTSPIRLWYRLHVLPRIDHLLVQLVELYPQMTFA